LAVLLAMTTDLDAGSPAGRLYGECLANALAVYLLNRYTVRRYMPVACTGGLPGYRLKRVLDHVGDNLAEDLSLAQLAAVVGMSPHYFAELFRRSTHICLNVPIPGTSNHRGSENRSAVTRATRWLSTRSG